MKRIFALVIALLAVGTLAIAQSQKNAPLTYDKAGDRDDSVTLTQSAQVTNLTPTSATITWQTNKNGANHVRYGTDPNHPDKSKYVPGGSTQHSMTLTDLQPGKTYYFFIMERDQEVRQGGTGSFTTPASGGQMKPTSMGSEPQAPGSESRSSVRITNGPGVQNITGTTAQVFWNTSAPSGAVVRYGTARDNLSQTAEEPWGQTSHSVELKNLQPNTTYFFQIDSAQAQNTGTEVKSGIGTFRTKAQ
jgi:phosphodiesterase/alkaline phosphatase D-like protein